MHPAEQTFNHGNPVGLVLHEDMDDLRPTIERANSGSDCRFSDQRIIPIILGDPEIEPLTLRSDRPGQIPTCEVFYCDSIPFEHDKPLCVFEKIEGVVSFTEYPSVKFTMAILVYFVYSSVVLLLCQR